MQIQQLRKSDFTACPSAQLFKIATFFRQTPLDVAYFISDLWQYAGRD
jgi:hypothetical protein